MSDKKPPEFKVLKPIDPEELEDGIHSPNLEEYLEEYRRYEAKIWEEFLEVEPGSYAEQLKARELAKLYFLEAAHKQQTSSDGALWSERFNQLVAELYGKPEVSELVVLAEQELDKLPEDSELRVLYEEVISAYDPDQEAVSEIPQKLNDSDLEKVRKALFNHQAPIFENLDKYEHYNEYEVSKVEEIVNEIITVLTDISPEWNNWNVIRNSRTSLWVDPERKEICIPEKRKPYESFSDLRRVIAHEVGAHAFRAVSGYEKGDSDLARGLADYLEAEEGLGIFFGYLSSGVISDSVRDKYFDAAIAYGIIPELQMSREELIEFATKRRIERERAKGVTLNEDEVLSAQGKATRHVNRLFRGGDGKVYETPTGTTQAVFIKDIVYYLGVRKIEGFIKKKMNAGHDPENILKYLLQGKFDPTNEIHLEYISAKDDCFLLDDESPKTNLA
ncbi:MAG: hypothetical protein R3346_02150 [Candidatus Spechtbacterales bacterium]|nr:hypothetical protein [Candidatus Spechtbacterales bacterium]